MSQEQREIRRRARRTANAQRNRPTLVTAKDSEQQTSAFESYETTTATVDQEPEQPIEVTEAKEKPKVRRGFFLTTGKKDAAAGEKDEVAQERLARATRGKSELEAKQESVAKKPAAARTPTKGGFKTRYIVGMALYLLCANFVGSFEVQGLRSAGLDRVLTTFNLFGGKMVVSTSTIAFIATLVILLILLAKFDLIPSSLGMGMNTARPVSKTGSSEATPGVPAPKFTQPAVRQGVAGEHDDLYQEYRSNQRRSKKK